MKRKGEYELKWVEKITTKSRVRLIGHFKYTFEHFKHIYIYFHTLFYPHIYKKYPNNIIKLLYQTT